MHVPAPQESQPDLTSSYRAMIVAVAVSHLCVLCCRPLLFVFGAQPLSQPLASVTFHRPIGFTDWPQAEVVGRTNHHLVEGLYYCLPVAKAPASPPRAEPFNWTSFANFSSARCLSGRFRASSSSCGAARNTPPRKITALGFSKLTKSAKATPL